MLLLMFCFFSVLSCHKCFLSTLEYFAKLEHMLLALYYSQSHKQSCITAVAEHLSVTTATHKV